jgi:CheY-like chemotaxis protein
MVDMRTPDDPGLSQAHADAQIRRPLSILIVEDDSDAAGAQARLLELAGHTVHVVADGLAALEAVGNHAPDVILLDLGLPRLNGYEVARRIREQPWTKRPLLVAVTGFSEPRHREYSDAVGIDLHLVKPVDHDMLEKLLTRFHGVVGAG